MPDQLLTVRQACEQLQVSRTLLYRLLHEGELKSVTLSPRARRIPQSAVTKLIAKRSQARVGAA